MEIVQKRDSGGWDGRIRWKQRKMEVFRILLEVKLVGLTVGSDMRMNEGGEESMLTPRILTSTTR